MTQRLENMVRWRHCKPATAHSISRLSRNSPGTVSSLEGTFKTVDYPQGNADYGPDGGGELGPPFEVGRAGTPNSKPM